MAGNSKPKTGILALQGDFSAHEKRLKELGHDTVLIKNAPELSLVKNLVIPGGESTTLLRLLSKDLRNTIIERIEQGMPVLATCAGVILLAKNVTRPEQDSLGVLDITVERNSYGRQVDSFITNELSITEDGRKLLKLNSNTLEGIFIRAPRITRAGKKVKVLITFKDEPVLVQEGNIFAATFHPELTQGFNAIHNLLST